MTIFYLTVIFLVQVTASLAQNCSCETGAASFIQVCGTNGKTYKSVCSLKSAQTANSTLGVRCLGQCPCLVDNTVFPIFNLFINQFACYRPFVNPYLGGFGFRGRRSAREIENKIFGFEFSYTSAFHFHHQEPTICMTNGVEVHGYQAAKCAISKNNAVGVRCLGRCRFCNATLSCPVAPVTQLSTPASTQTPMMTSTITSVPTSTQSSMMTPSSTLGTASVSGMTSTVVPASASTQTSMGTSTVTSTSVPDVTSTVSAGNITQSAMPDPLPLPDFLTAIARVFE